MVKSQGRTRKQSNIALFIIAIIDYYKDIIGIIIALQFNTKHNKWFVDRVDY